MTKILSTQQLLFVNLNYRPCAVTITRRRTQKKTRVHFYWLLHASAAPLFILFFCSEIPIQMMTSIETEHLPFSGCQWMSRPSPADSEKEKTKKKHSPPQGILKWCSLFINSPVHLHSYRKYFVHLITESNQIKGWNVSWDLIINWLKKCPTWLNWLVTSPCNNRAKLTDTPTNKKSL